MKYFPRISRFDAVDSLHAGSCRCSYLNKGPVMASSSGLMPRVEPSAFHQIAEVRAPLAQRADHFFVIESACG
jgi:hypothetical protein